MTIHDGFARVTPYEIAVPGRAFADERFGEVRDEADQRVVDAWDPASFVMLAQVGRMVRDIRGEDDDPALIHQYGVILYHAFHFWKEGEHLYLVDTAAARRLTGDFDGGARVWTPVAPAQAGYFQLPQLLFWARPDLEEPPEAIDGLFWVLTPARQLHLLVALGIHKARPGFSVIPLPAMSFDEAPTWAEEPARPDGADFASSLPGSEIDRLYSLETHGEALKLCARLFRHLELGPSVIGSPQERGVAAGPEDGPLASTLPYRTVGPGEAS